MSLYQPLPQCNTDSNSEDSEEELQSGRETHIVSRSSLRSENIATQNPIRLNCKSSSENVYVATTTSEFMPPVTVLKPTVVTKPRMSPLRKTLFVLSIFLCIFTVVGFLWLLPCDVDTCSVVDQVPKGSKGWETPLSSYELHGPAVAVPRAVGKGKNLVLLGRLSGSATPSPLPHHIICLLGSSGEVVWKHIMAREPVDIDCSMIDVNRDGVKDCIVAGYGDLLKVINPLSGLKLWELPKKATSPWPNHTQFPALLPDVTGDGMHDLLSAWSYPESGTLLLIVSGASGQVIGKPVPTPLCITIKDLLLEKDFSVSYTCHDVNNKISEQTISLQDLLQSAGHTAPKSAFEKDSSAISDVPDSFDSGGSHEARVDGRRLLLENNGRCPNDCSVAIVVKDRDNRTVYNKSLNGVYGMTPVTLSFDKLSGFVMKLWHWPPKKTGRKANSTLVGQRARVPNANRGSEILKSSTGKSAKSKNIWQEIVERVVLITFNETDLHVVNISQQEVVLMCSSRLDCQPSVQGLQRSLLIADLDADGSKEIVSYTSSYVSSPDSDSMKLESHVRVVRIEDELPQLFEAFNQI